MATTLPAQPSPEFEIEKGPEFELGPIDEPFARPAGVGDPHGQATPRSPAPPTGPTSLAPPPGVDAGGTPGATPGDGMPAAAPLAAQPERRAHALSRALALFLDAGVLVAVDIVLGATLVTVLAVIEAWTGQPVADAGELKGQLLAAGSFAASLLYFVVLHAGEGQTLGKALVNIRVCRVDGSDLGLARSALRWVASLLSALLFGAGYLMAFGRRRRALHDHIAGTVVVRV